VHREDRGELRFRRRCLDSLLGLIDVLDREQGHDHPEAEQAERQRERELSGWS
jgi:hypothetical protein